ncbi:hypothetical protein LTR84_000419 [Exophiala bonariae]|uniref:Uncharacterized protein n=1 Tax=Exophiala bonariae TaxID=1690606 RepID=A0AAV9NR58_9EURO|nr:hypothetical protein LTR84_000419 [Exophiala bonariae]
MSTTTSMNTSVRNVLRGADPITTRSNQLENELRGPVDAHEENFLTANNGVTGREPNTNPQDWLTDHRRVPAHRPPVTHQEWVTIGGPLPMRIFLWNMFSGCQLLQWGYTIARVTGMHDRGFGMYMVANEW